MAKGAASNKVFIRLVVGLIIAISLAPVIYDVMTNANKTGKITGTQATLFNLIPLFYFIGLVVFIVAALILAHRQTIDLSTLLKKYSPGQIVIRVIIVRVNSALVMVVRLQKASHAVASLLALFMRNVGSAPGV